MFHAEGSRIRIQSAAPGYRYRNTGAPDNAGNEGSVWSASAAAGSTTAWRLVFNATSMSSADALYRGNGFLLRCLSE